ncbi:MAG: aromatic amino acid transport family protein [Patescibacteria group bacterium]|nr:aromatic amino acid transport family protein [Patescibacteria group bacterium]
MSKSYLLAVATLMGAIIGVGLFAIPFVASKTGVLPLFIFMIGLAAAQYLLHLLFAEAVLATKDKHRLPGLVGKYWSNKGKKYVLIIEVVSSYGSTLAYIIAGGLFLHQLLNPYLGGSIFLYSTGLFLAVSAITFFDIKLIAGTEFILTAFLLATIGLITWRGFGHIQLSNYHLINWGNFFLLYGAVFFTVGGGAAIPEVCRLLDNEKNKIKSAIAWGTFLSATLMLVFIMVILGITGDKSSVDALAGLGAVLHDGVVTFSLVFGLLAVITSYVVTAQAAEEIFEWDFKMSNKLAWFLASCVPYFFYLIGWADLTKTISFTGAVTGGVAGIILIWLVFKIKARPEQPSAVNNKLSKPLAYFLSALFILGMIYEIWNIL